jgi:hypothetical protein
LLTSIIFLRSIFYDPLIATPIYSYYDILSIPLLLQSKYLIELLFEVVNHSILLLSSNTIEFMGLLF